MKFLIDMPLSPDLAYWLNQQGHDAVHASNIGLYNADDVVIIDTAKKEQRIIVTADLDYPRLLALTKAEGPGLILFRGGNYNEQEAIFYMEYVLKIIPEGELSSSIVVVEKERIRRRRLPLNRI